MRKLSWDNQSANSVESAPPKSADIGKALLNATGAACKQLEPLKYPWAFKFYQQQQQNFWLPSEVPMGDDISHWRSDKLSDQDRNTIKKTLAMFACFEFEVGDNLAINLYRLVTNPECRMFLLAQGSIEAVHQQAYSLLVESLGVDKEYAYSGHQTIETIKAKTEWADSKTKEISDASFNTRSIENKRKFLLNIIAFLLVEGVSFYGGFAALLVFSLRNLMPGMAKQVTFIARDENLHCQFATKLATTLCQEEPALWNTECVEKTREMANDVLRMEMAFVDDTIPQGLPGMNKNSLKSHLTYLTNRRLLPFGVEIESHEDAAPLKWLSEALELSKEGNFFETSITEYSKGGLNWDD